MTLRTRVSLVFVFLAGFAFSQKVVEVPSSAAVYYDETGLGKISNILHLGNSIAFDGRTYFAIDFPVRLSDFPGTLANIQGLSLALTQAEADTPASGQLTVYLATNNSRSLTLPAEKYVPTFAPGGVNTSESGPFGKLIKLGTATVKPGGVGYPDRVGFRLSAEDGAKAFAQIRDQQSLRLVVAAAGTGLSQSFVGAGAKRPRLTVVEGPAPSAQAAAALPLVGTWLLGRDNAVAATFTQDGRFYLATDTSLNGVTGRKGIEVGRYSWNPTSKAFTAYAGTNTDGPLGLSEFLKDATLEVSGGGSSASLRMGSTTVEFTRVESATSSLVGAWVSGSEGSVSAFLFTSTSDFFLVQDAEPFGNGRAGMERGTYTWFASGAQFSSTVSVDDNGGWGFSTASASQTANVSGDMLYYTGQGANLTFLLRRVAATYPTSRLINLSVRTGTGGTLGLQTVGFSIGGTGNKPIFARCVGPSLSQIAGVTSWAEDPVFYLFSGQNRIALNDNWGGDAGLAATGAAAGAFALLTPTSKDAVIYSPSLPIGNYTYQADDLARTGRDAVLEIYDATPAATLTTSPSRLVNLSALLNFASSDGVTAGFAIRGTGPKTVLIRAVGPGLKQFDVLSPLADPRVRLFGAPYPYTNDDWQGGEDLTALFPKVGAFALDPTSHDAVLLVTLEPGNYTAQVTSATSNAGRVLIEVYEVQ